MGSKRRKEHQVYAHYAHFMPINGWTEKLSYELHEVIWLSKTTINSGKNVVGRPQISLEKCILIKSVTKKYILLISSFVLRTTLVDRRFRLSNCISRSKFLSFELHQ